MDLEIANRLQSIRTFAQRLNIIDSLEVMNEVEEYRNFWKPDHVRVVILAESHKHTTKSDFQMTHSKDLLNQLTAKGLRMYPSHFVRFVYCLGYGEFDCLDSSPRSNFGTPDYWQILFSSKTRISRLSDFDPMLRYDRKRIEEKINLLTYLKKQGHTWLVDSSPLALDVFGGGIKREIIRKSWDLYTGPLLNSLSDLRHIIIIGSTVESALSSRLRNFVREHIGVTIRCPAFPQPRRRPLEISDYIEIYNICNQI